MTPLGMLPDGLALLHGEAVGLYEPDEVQRSLRAQRHCVILPIVE